MIIGSTVFYTAPIFTSLYYLIILLINVNIYFNATNGGHKSSSKSRVKYKCTTKLKDMTLNKTDLQPLKEELNRSNSEPLNDTYNAMYHADTTFDGMYDEWLVLMMLTINNVPFKDVINIAELITKEDLKVNPDMQLVGNDAKYKYYEQYYNFFKVEINIL